MATKVVMEALSPTMEEGRLVEWKMAEGAKVSVGDVLAEVETDKAIMELVARVDGTLLKHLVPAGSTVPVADPVGIIGEPGEDISEGYDSGGSGSSEGSDISEGSGGGEAADVAVTAPQPRSPAAPLPGGRVKASPLARRIAEEQGIDLSSVTGSGPGGRIVKRDLAGVAAARPGAAPVTATGGFEDIPLSLMRKTIAKRLVESIGPVPTFYLTVEIDMERTWDAREALKLLGPDGKVSFNDIIIKATALALKQHPECNAWWQGDAIRQWYEVHLGMAVAIDDGLITPVIRHADQKSLREISAEARVLAEKARKRKLMPEEYTGATFTVSNLGAFGIDHFTAIINPPEAGILAIGGITQQPVVVDGELVVRRRMLLTMSCDHRVIDGAMGAAFLQTLRAYLENPLAMVW
ncbi:MAG: dihydrolipoamide acetyltransferase family protein [Gemmatimonadetes bacterium]|nr:dihydrolipoamide acetyltransferase family protein [Gemmatimonadota bacterium]